MASAVEPKLMLLDEPASGLSYGERERLTELLLGLPDDVTLILIEHDMDVALTVAGYVTMMHDGRKVVEGTPAEIRGNQMVHDIYLGSRFHEDDASERRARSRSRRWTPPTARRRRSRASRSRWVGGGRGDRPQRHG